MSLSTETSNLTLAYINSVNNKNQLETNIRDSNNNIEKLNNVVNDLYEKLDINIDEISIYKNILLDLSNNLH
jgi:hypothetical protein